MKAGDCEDCGQFWSLRAGGINEDGQCTICAARFPVMHSAARERHDQNNMEQALDMVGVGLGAC